MNFHDKTGTCAHSTFEVPIRGRDFNMERNLKHSEGDLDFPESVMSCENNRGSVCSECSSTLTPDSVTDTTYEAQQVSVGESGSSGGNNGHPGKSEIRSAESVSDKNLGKSPSRSKIENELPEGHNRSERVQLESEQEEADTCLCSINRAISSTTSPTSMNAEAWSSLRSNEELDPCSTTHESTFNRSDSREEHLQAIDQDGLKNESQSTAVNSTTGSTLDRNTSAPIPTSLFSSKSTDRDAVTNASTSSCPSPRGTQASPTDLKHPATPANSNTSFASGCDMSKDNVRDLQLTPCTSQNEVELENTREMNSLSENMAWTLDEKENSAGTKSQNVADGVFTSNPTMSPTSSISSDSISRVYRHSKPPAPKQRWWKRPLKAARAELSLWTQSGPIYGTLKSI